MAKRKTSQQPPPIRWEQHAAVGLVLVTGLALCWVVRAQPTLGVAGQHAYGYHPAPQHRGFLLLVVASAPLACALAILLFRRRGLTRWGEWALVALVSVGSLALHSVAATAPKVYPGMELAWPFLWTNTEGSYAHLAGHVGRLDRFVSNYVHVLDVSPDPKSPHWVHIHHGQVHPPGLVLGFACADRFYGAFPSADRAVLGIVSAVFPRAAELLGSANVSVRHPLSVSMTAALVVIALASAAPLACYLALRGIWPRDTVLVATLLTAFVPGTYLFSPSVDQAYPAIVLVLLGLGLRAASRRRWPWAAAFGVVLYGAMFVHVGMALVAVILGLCAVLAWRALKPAWGLRQVAAAYWRPAAAAVLGFLTPAFVLQLWLGYPTFRVILACLRNNRLFNAAIGRTYWPWVAVTPFEFAISLGAALGSVCAVACLLEVGGAVRERSLVGRSALLLSVVAVLAMLGVLGMNRGETPRLWLFATPLLVVGAVDYLCRGERPRRLLVALVLCQWLQLVLLRVLLDPGWTSTFFTKHLMQQ